MARTSKGEPNVIILIDCPTEQCEPGNPITPLFRSISNKIHPFNGDTLAPSFPSNFLSELRPRSNYYLFQTIKASCHTILMSCKGSAMSESWMYGTHNCSRSRTIALCLRLHPLLSLCSIHRSSYLLPSRKYKPGRCWNFWNGAGLLSRSEVEGNTPSKRPDH